MEKQDPNKWSDLKKVRCHLEHGDGFQVNDGSGMFNDNPPKYVVFQGRDYLGYAHYSLTKSIIKELLKHGVTERQKKLLNKLTIAVFKVSPQS